MSALGVTGVLEAAAGLALVAGVGRIVLSLLPPGPPGGHAPRELATTWASSHLCGAVALSAELRLAAFAGVELAPGRAWPAALWLLLPWALVLGARRLLSPGAMVPRHEPRRERGGRATLVARIVLVAATLAPLVRALARPAPDPLPGPGGVGSSLALESLVAPFTGAPAASALLYPASFAALVVLLASGLASARRAPFGRHAILALFVLTPVVQRLAAARTPALPVALCVGAGAAFAVPWLRRADRRAAALCALGFSGAALFDPRAALLGLAGLASTCLVTAAPSRGRFANVAAIAFVPLALLGGAHAALAGALGDLASYRGRLGSLVRASLEFETWELRWLALVPVLLVALRLVRRPPAEATVAEFDGPVEPRVDTPGRELAALLAALTLGLLAQAVGATLDRDAALLPVATLGALAVGLALSRGERTVPGIGPGPDPGGAS